MSSKDSIAFCVYVHRRKDNNAIFYVGKGKDNRHNRPYQRNQYWTRVAAKHGFFADITSTHQSEMDAFAQERFLIASLRLFCKLTNITDGGEGNAGLKHSDKTKAQMSAKRKNKPLGDEHRANVVAAQKRPEVNLKRSQSIRAFYANDDNAAAYKKIATQRNQRQDVRKNVGAGVSRSRRSTGYVTPVINATTGQLFECLSDAAAWLRANGKPKANHSAILQVASKPDRTAYGYRWEYPTTSQG